MKIIQQETPVLNQYLKALQKLHKMKKSRRDFLKLTGMAGIGITAGPGMLKGTIPENDYHYNTTGSTANMGNMDTNNKSVIGQYGQWAQSLQGNKLPSLSFRNNNWQDLEQWKKAARQRVIERLGIPDIPGIPKVTVKSQHTFDGLHIEELTWQLPYGNPTEAILLKPQNAKGQLPAVLAFHDHGGNKYFGSRKITKTSDKQHPLMKEHQSHYYSDLAWANEIAKRGYVVLVPDAFAFASRRVMLDDLPDKMRNGNSDSDPENPVNIQKYNDWAAEHEHVLAKSLFCAGTTWPAVFFAEDQKALDILCARADVDPKRVGCGGLSGGGLRTVFMAGLDPRIRCAVDVGFTTTWKDFMLNKSFTHTWMTYVPLLPRELDFPEILGLRTPLPTLVLNDTDDQLYTLPEMQAAENILSEIYKKAGAPANFKCSYYPGLHKFDAKMQAEAFDWFDRWLKA
jgi:dienelactone hydrolase